MFSSERWALTGEAGVFTDPFYSPGSDFIGMGNDLITEMILRDGDGIDIRRHAAAFNVIYLRLFEAFTKVYENQYQIFGHARVMTAKVAWDNACYWGVSALLFFQRKYRDYAFIQSIDPLLRRFFALHVQMQDYLRDWHLRDTTMLVDGFASVVEEPYLWRLQNELDAEHDDASLRATLEANVAWLEKFAAAFQALASTTPDAARSADDHPAGRGAGAGSLLGWSNLRCHELRLTGSGGANRVMEAELKRLVMRSPFGVRLENPKREDEGTLLYPFEACIAWVAACYHRTSSRVSWDLCSSPAVRLEPLFGDLLPALSSDDRLPGGPSLRFSSRWVPRSTSRRRHSSSAASSRTRSSRPWRREAWRPKSTPTRLTSSSSCAAPAHLKRGVPWSASTSAAGRGIAVARAWRPGLRPCARRWRRS